VIRHGGALLTQLLIDHGVRVVFGLPGGQTLALYDGICARPGEIHHLLVRDERTSAYAADAYARMTGRVGVCDATVGPGTAKLPSGLSEALGSSIPVVALVSELPARMAPHRYRGAVSQALDQQALLAPVTKWLATVPDAATMPALVEQAFREATTGRPGPTALFLPQDVLDGPVPDHLSAELTGDVTAAVRANRARFGRFPAFRPHPEAEDVKAAVAALGEASRPVLLAGGGVLSSGAQEQLLRCAELLSCAVVTSLSGKGAIAEDHPLALGVVGGMGTPAAADALDEADVVLMVGTKAGSGPTASWQRPRRDQTIVHIDVDPAELGRAYPGTIPVLADARAGLAAVSDLLQATTRPDRSEWAATIADHAASWRGTRDAERRSSERPVHPQRVLGELEKLLTPDDVVVCDASLASGWAGVFLEQRWAGRSVVMPRGQAGLGFALPAAIGVAVAKPKGRTVVLTGDGALGYAVGEFATVMEQRLPITVLVLNNSSLGWIRWYRRITFERDWESEDFADVNFGAVAQAYGWHAERVEDPDAVYAAVSGALQHEGPALVDIITETWQTPVAGHRRALSTGTTSGYGG